MKKMLMIALILGVVVIMMLIRILLYLMVINPLGRLSFVKIDSPDMNPRLHILNY